MIDNVNYTHNSVKGGCAWPDMELSVRTMHTLRMAKTPQWRITQLRKWRVHRKKTLADTSEKMGLTHGQLSKIERGIQPYNQKVLEIAALEYETTVVDLLTRSPPVEPKTKSKPKRKI